MNLREELIRVDLDIKNLKSKKIELTNKLIKEINEKDTKTILKHLDKLLSIYKHKQPSIYNKIIVSCFPLKTHICCGAAGYVKRIYLSDLLKLWSNGYTYKGYPITNIMSTNSGYQELSYIKDGEIKHIHKDEFDISHYNYMIQKILDKDFVPKELYSKTSVSDLFKKD